ncbi:MAG: response regulator transcription factor [Verrucomicrobia bacterium]|nr:response regulator transcription factor [Verrucomicrobiota bacterium]
MSHSSTPLRILIADDHDIVREGLRTMIAMHRGWQVCGEATTGREAVTLALQFKPHIVALDFSMPELNGIEAARQIRKALPQTEALLLTMHESEQLAQEALAVGVRGLLLKTEVRKFLVSAVEALSQHKPFFTPQMSEWIMQGRLHPETSSASSRPRRGALTPREREIVQLVAEGRSNKAIAALLGRSVKTVESHRANLMNKLHLRSVSELVRYAIRNKLIGA